MAWLDDRDGVCRLFLFNQAPFPLQLFNQNFLLSEHLQANRGFEGALQLTSVGSASALTIQMNCFRIL